MKRRIYHHLTVQVLAAILIGIAVGHWWPSVGVGMKPLSDGFIRLVRMVVGPIVFLTIVVGIASMGDLKKVGRVGWKALVYFEGVTTLALGIGMVVANIVRPGEGFAGHAPMGQSEVIAQYASAAKQESVAQHLLHIIPDTMVGALAGGDLLPVLFVAILTGVAVSMLKGEGDEGVGRILGGLVLAERVMFRMVGIVMIVAPLGALGAMGYTIGKYGVHTLAPLAKLMACVYLTMALFVFAVLGGIGRMYGISIWRFLIYIREELLLVLGTSSSESALPGLIDKLERAGCSRGVVGLVVPAGYSFNLDGTSIYLSIALLFIAQAYGIHLTLGEQVRIMLVMILTSKGAAGVTGAGFICLAATIGAVGKVPVEGLALILGVDRFMSEARAITNLIGNGMATMVVSRWEGERGQLSGATSQFRVNATKADSIDRAGALLKANPEALGEN